MDYEKKYKEALSQARFYYGNCPTEPEKKKLEKLFPELRESEDERIRRTLVEYFGPEVQIDLVRGIPIQKIRDWLEKQKEQKPNIELIQRSWYMEGYHDREFGKEPKWIVKTDEGGPRYEENPKYGQMLAEQKPAEWSEDDEKMIWDIVGVLEADNEENKKKYPYALSRHELYKKMVDWLTSLRPSWKPSEEQMSMLRAVINDPNNAGAESCQIALRGIYENLKNL